MYIGVDVSKLKLDARLIGPKGDHHKQVPNTPRGIDDLHRWTLSRTNGVVPIYVMESTGSYHMLPAAILHGLGGRVAVLNPRRARDFCKALGLLQKTDRADARALALYGERCQPQEWRPALEALQELRALVIRLLALTDQERRETLRLEEGPRVVCWLSVASSILRMLAMIEGEKKQLVKDIDAFYEAHPPLHDERKLLLTVSGIGKPTADHLLCLIRHHGVTSARDAAAMVGVVPVHRESGTSVHSRPRISREGDKRVRTALFMPAFTAIKCNPQLREKYTRLVERGLSKRAAQVAVMHQMVRIAFGILKHRRPYDPERLPQLA
jgi:transposase